MNVAQALAVAAAALVVAIGPERISTASAQVADALAPQTIRATVSELADLMESNYVFPDAARQYADHLRQRAATGAYDGITNPQELAATLQTELRRVHDDAHLRIALTEADSASSQAGPRRRVQSGPAIGNETWLADGVAYFRVNGFPGDEASVAAMARILDEFADANTLIIDARFCPGGGLREMDVLFSRIFAERTHLVTMDTRTGANANLEAVFNDTRTLRLVDAPPTITRREHWAEPAAQGGALANARVFLLTDRTASACEHLALALKETGRATLVGGTTRGAGHYGGDRVFGDGRFSVFVPVGRTYAPRTGEGWEGVGIAPDRAVDAEEALNEVLREIDVPLSAAANVAPFEAPMRRVVQAAPGRRAYGIGVFPPRGGESYIRVEEVAQGMVAEQAGIRAGDRILAINGIPVGEIAPPDFPGVMRSSPMTMVVEREGEQLTFEMSLEG